MGSTSYYNKTSTASNDWKCLTDVTDSLAPSRTSSLCTASSGNSFNTTSPSLSSLSSTSLNSSNTSVSNDLLSSTTSSPPSSNSSSSSSSSSLLPSPKRLKTNAATLRHLGFLKPVINYKRGRGGRRGAICVTMEDHAEAA